MACRGRGLCQLQSDLMRGVERVTRTLARELMFPLLLSQVLGRIAVGETFKLVNLCCPLLPDA